MNNLLTWLLTWVAGGLLGVFFYGGLWWTVQQVVSEGHSALYLVASLLVRTSVTVMGFYFVSDGRFERLIVCMIGFVVARVIVTRVTRPPADSVELRMQAEATHAS
jgi:F1F0 ATPase subunit 2